MYASADGTGVPMRKKELAGRAGKQPDGSAKTRMAYLGCVFTRHQTDENGHPVRDYQSTTHVSSIGPIQEIGLSLTIRNWFAQIGPCFTNYMAGDKQSNGNNRERMPWKRPA